MDIVHGPISAHTGLCGKFPRAFIISENLDCKLCWEKTWANSIHSNAIFAPFLCHGSGQLTDSTFRGTIGDAVWHCTLRLQACNVDNLSPISLLHACNYFFAKKY